MSDSRNFLASHSISSFPLLSSGRAPVRQTQQQLSLALPAARDFLAREAPTNPALEDIAQLCCFSKSHFLRQYRLAFGMTPGEYVVQRKLKIAQVLVTATKYSVTQIANLSGYDSSSAFCRSFKACFGHSPQRFGRLYAA